ncbi:MAG: hypothetical protein WC490_07360 [Candidatus Margulisiibacteriota bacterium]
MTNRLREFVFEMLQIANKAVAKAQEKNRKLGVPNVYAKNGKPVFVLPNGKMTTRNPF